MAMNLHGHMYIQRMKIANRIKHVSVAALTFVVFCKLNIVYKYVTYVLVVR